MRHGLDSPVAGRTCSFAEGADTREVSAESDMSRDEAEPEGGGRASEFPNTIGVQAGVCVLVSFS